MYVFAYTVFWGSGSTEKGLVRADSLDDAVEKVGAWAGGKPFHVRTLEELMGEKDFYITYNA